MQMFQILYHNIFRIKNIPEAIFLGPQDHSSFLMIPTELVSFLRYVIGKFTALYDRNGYNVGSKYKANI